jgi:DNA invertase Pin-like site-specific DNA recombinase
VTDPALRPAFYARTSTGKQQESLEAQVARLRSAAPGAAEFIDGAVSGRAADRPGFDRLLAEVRTGRLDSVTVTKLDRLGRSAGKILDFFTVADVHHVRVVVLDQQIDTSTPVGRALRTVLAALAELEGDLIRERTQEAMDALGSGARPTRSGKPVGRPAVLTPELLARIRELRETPDPGGKRRTWNTIAKVVHHPAGSCKKWYASRRESPRVINPSREFRVTPSGESIAPRAGTVPFGAGSEAPQ